MDMRISSTPGKADLSPPISVSSRSIFSGPLGRPVIHLLAVVILVVIVYSNTLGVPFVLDDRAFIVDNPNIRGLWKIPHLFAGMNGPVASRPTMLATLAVNYRVGGNEVGGYHVVNMALHVLNALLLYAIVFLTVGRMGWRGEGASGVAFITAVLWASHPVQTEAVTYVVSRSVLLAGFFYLLGMVLFIKAVTSAGRGWTYIGLLFPVCLLGMGSKENFVTFPAMLLLYDYCFVSGGRVRGVLVNWRAHLPGMVSLFYLAFLYFNFSSQLQSYGTPEVGRLEYLMTQFKVHWTYLRLILLPVGQNLDYDYPVAGGFLYLPTLVGFIGYAGLWAAGLFLIRRSPAVSFLLLWFMIALTPSSSVVPLRNMIFEHRLYLPSAGAAAAVGLGVIRLMGVREARGVMRAVVPAFLVVAVLFSILAYARNSVWGEELCLWGDAAGKSPGKARPHNNLGAVYAGLGRYEDAEREYLAAFGIDPGYAEARFNLALLEERRGRYEEAVREYLAALGIDPGYAEARFNIARIHERHGRYEEAVREYLAALEIDPDFHRAHNNLGIIYAGLGRYDEAAREFRSSLNTDPDNAEVLNNLGNAYNSLGLFDNAVRAYKAAIRTSPESAVLHNSLGNVYYNMGLNDNAASEYRAALRRDPDFARAHDNLGIVYLEQGRYEGAVREFGSALGIEPGNAGFRENLSRAYELMGKERGR
jgi:tetratricopeptide (TPR) repeat protein